MRIFISSTSHDLAAHRRVVEQLILDAQCSPVAMEHFGADPRPIVQLCKEEVAGCDLVILIQAWRRGSVPTVKEGGDGTTSITAWEIRAADGEPGVRRKTPVLAFLADDEWPGKLWEGDADARKSVETFRLGLNRSAKFFKWETTRELTAFRSLVREQLNLYLSGRRPGPAAPPVPAFPLAIRRIPPEPSSLPAEPYPLLGPYNDPRTFAGRDVEIERLATLVAGPQLILCLHAPSGAGKSSLLLAGLAPRLRAAGCLVSIERAPGDPGIARRLLQDVLMLDPAELPADDAADLPARFAQFTAQAYVQAENPLVFIIDQLDDVLRSAAKRTDALATLGVLLAATAQRLPGSQGYPCTWIFCYRHEFHGEVRGWLEDVLSTARAQKRSGIASLPWDLSDAQKSVECAIPVFGRVAVQESTGDSPLLPFIRAILTPLEAAAGGGRPYPYVIAEADGRRLAAAFADLRRQRPEAPLVPELQIVLNDLLRRAREHVSLNGTLRPVVVPDGEALTAQIRFALRDHIESALNRAFPPLTGGVVGRQSRTRALLALRALADAKGLRTERLPQAEVAKMIGPDGAAVLTKLSAADTRLIVIDEEGQCALSHDCLSEALTEVVESPAYRGALTLDQRLIDLRRIVGQKAALFESDPTDTSTLVLSRQHREMMRINRDLLLDSGERSVWWTAVEDKYRQRQTNTLIGVAVAAFLAVVAGLILLRLFNQSDRQQLQTQLVQALSSQRAEFGDLVHLAHAHPYDWSEVRDRFDTSFLKDVNPEVFIKGVDQSKFSPDDVVSVIERGYRLFVTEPKLFGAMSFALEEVTVHAGRNNEFTTRARDVFHRLRNAFLEDQKARTPDFKSPPARPEDDALNPWRSMAGGANLRAFSIQQHEVTNDEYRRFDPTHQYKGFTGSHPVNKVSWYESAAYAAWLGASLPSEAEWQHAAFGTTPRRYPWLGIEPVAVTRAVYDDDRGPQPIEGRPDGRTPELVEDLLGNIAEWCRDRATRSENPTGPINRVVRGGSYRTRASELPSARDNIGPGFQNVDVGIRLVSPRLD
jgi:hypothetical protein